MIQKQELGKLVNCLCSLKLSIIMSVHRTLVNFFLNLTQDVCKPVAIDHVGITLADNTWVKMSSKVSIIPDGADRKLRAPGSESPGRVVRSGRHAFVFL